MSKTIKMDILEGVVNTNMITLNRRSKLREKMLEEIDKIDWASVEENDGPYGAFLKARGLLVEVTNLLRIYKSSDEDIRSNMMTIKAVFLSKKQTGDEEIE